MDGLKDYQISVYVANLGKYVEGVLQGAWRACCRARGSRCPCPPNACRTP